MDSEHGLVNGEQPDRVCYNRLKDCRWETVRKVFEMLVDSELDEFKAVNGCGNVLATDDLARTFVRMVAPHYSTYVDEDALRDGLFTFRYSMLPYDVSDLYNWVLLEPTERDIRVWGSQEITVLLWHPNEAFATLVEKGALGQDVTAGEVGQCERRFKQQLYQHCAPLYATGWDMQLLDSNEHCRYWLKWPYKRLMGCPPLPLSYLGHPPNFCPCPHH